MNIKQFSFCQATIEDEYYNQTKKWILHPINNYVTRFLCGRVWIPIHPIKALKQKKHILDDFSINYQDIIKGLQE